VEGRGKKGGKKKEKKRRDGGEMRQFHGSHGHLHAKISPILYQRRKKGKKKKKKRGEGKEKGDQQREPRGGFAPLYFARKEKEKKRKKEKREDQNRASLKSRNVYIHPDPRKKKGGREKKKKKKGGGKKKKKGGPCAGIPIQYVPHGMDKEKEKKGKKRGREDAPSIRKTLPLLTTISPKGGGKGKECKKKKGNRTPTRPHTSTKLVWEGK